MTTVDNELRKSFNNAVGCFGALSIALPLLKLIGYIEVPWLWATSLWWISIAFPVLPMIVVGCLTLIFYMMKGIIRPSVLDNPLD